MKRKATHDTSAPRPGYFSEPVLAWWPNFKSRLCDPFDELCILPHALKVKMKAKARKLEHEAGAQ